MDTTGAAGTAPADEAEKKYLNVRQAAFIGVGAMVGARDLRAAGRGGRGPVPVQVGH